MSVFFESLRTTVNNNCWQF